MGEFKHVCNFIFNSVEVSLLCFHKIPYFITDYAFMKSICVILSIEALDQLQCESSSLKNEFEIDEQQLRDLRRYKQNQLDKAW